MRGTRLGVPGASSVQLERIQWGEVGGATVLCSEL